LLIHWVLYSHEISVHHIESLEAVVEWYYDHV
jgi:hypothetical protein